MLQIAYLTFVHLFGRYSQLGRKQLMSMSPVPELEEFHRDSLENASLLNRYVTDISNCLVYEKVKCLIKSLLPFLLLF